MITREGGSRIITFYSYKGGTGRSMAVANSAWLLASRGYRVLAIDWDLEAPGLHRYFEPFIADKLLEKSTGVIDFVLDFANAALVQTKEEVASDWHLAYANIRAHAIPVIWEFPNEGLLHLVPAGRQDSGYPLRVNAFDWRQFYERLGGGVWLETVKRLMRESYDYILIDSRTGVSDTSGICTVQMPDDLVVCFTLNNQSMRGASAVAASALQQRRTENGTAKLKVWPLPMRVESAEQERLEMGRALARTRFSGLMEHLPLPREDAYWGEVEIAYFPFYAYEEVLAAFADRPFHSRTLLACMESLLSFLEPGLATAIPMQEDVRLTGWQRFIAHPASDALEDLRLISEEYGRIRKSMDSSQERTYKMGALIERASSITGQEGIAQIAEVLFKMGNPGGRVLGLALARRDARRGHIDIALSGIGESRSPFEQYYALMLASQVQPLMDPTAKQKLVEVIQAQIKQKQISEDDRSRWTIAQSLLNKLENNPDRTSRTKPLDSDIRLVVPGGITCIDIRPPFELPSYDDPEEHHGRWVNTRMRHSLQLPEIYRIGRDLVTNAEFHRFVEAGCYQRDEFWPGRAMKRVRPPLAAYRRTLGPAAWVQGSPPKGKDAHPVTGVCYYEAAAFVAWLQKEAPVEGWRWTLPREDEWEFAARSESGLIYPWGDSFDSSKCNSSESGLNDTSEVEHFAAGASKYGCRDMAGNVWEFVLMEDSNEELCVMRGGSFKNQRDELRNYLRLTGVPREHRPPDFGFRIGQGLISD